MPIWLFEIKFRKPEVFFMQTAGVNLSKRNSRTQHVLTIKTVFQIAKPSNEVIRRAIVIDATTHAREWLGTATVLGFIDKVGILPTHIYASFLL